MTHHLNNDELNSYLHQTLTDAEREVLDRHLAECPSCRTRLDGHEALQRRIRYELAAELRGSQPSARMSYAAIAPRLNDSRRFTRVLKLSNQFLYGVLTMALLVTVGIGLYFFVSNLSRPAPTTPEEVKQPGIEPIPVGQLKWQFKAGGGVMAAPKVVNGLVYFSSTDDHLYAVDSETGREKWKFETGAAIYSSPAVAQGLVYFGSNDTYLYAVDSQTGQEQWKYKTGLGVRSYPVVVEGVVYFGSTDRHMYALDAQTGQEKWKFKTGDGILAAPVVAGGFVYFSSADDQFHALDSQTGQEQWTFKLGDRRTTGLGSSSTVLSAALGEETIYTGDVGQFYALDRQTGQIKWTFKAADRLSPVSGTAGELVYVQSARGLYALDSQTGQEQWRVKISHPTSTIAHGVIYAGTSIETALYALDAQTGQELWKFKGNREISTPTVADGVVYFGSEEGYLYAVWAGRPAAK